MDQLIEQLEARLTEIINDNGYQEIADGFEQALAIVKRWQLTTINPKKEPMSYTQAEGRIERN